MLLVLFISFYLLRGLPAPALLDQLINRRWIASWKFQHKFMKLESISGPQFRQEVNVIKRNEKPAPPCGINSVQIHGGSIFILLA